MNNLDYNLYEKENNLYKDLTSNLFFYQKYKDKPWEKGENFGDYLSKIIVGKIAKNYGFSKMKESSNKILAVGSILHFARTDDIIWGSGINGKIALDKLKFTNLDIKALRGPLTQEVLKKMNIHTPDIFGDPALLMPTLFPNLKYTPIKNKITIIPNLNEYEECLKITPKTYNLISPLRHWTFVFKEILSSEIVYTSSLHGLIICEAFKVPVALFKPFGGETMFKYEDYLEGTNRKLNKVPQSFNTSLKQKDGIVFNEIQFKLNKLTDTFPKEVFEKRKENEILSNM